LPFPTCQLDPAGILFVATGQGDLKADQVGERLAVIFQEVGVNEPIGLGIRAAPDGFEESNVVFHGNLRTPLNPSDLDPLDCTTDGEQVSPPRVIPPGPELTTMSTLTTDTVALLEALARLR
jgi:hypothetical protein